MACLITIAMTKGGVGKTTFATNIAVYLQEKGIQFDCVDLDPQGQFRTFSNARSRHITQEGIQKKGFNFLEYDSSKDVNLLEAIEKSTKDFVVVDLGGFDTDIVRYLCMISDIVVAPIAYTGADLDGLRIFRDAISLTYNQYLQKGEKVTPNIMVVLNKVAPNQKGGLIEDLKNSIQNDCKDGLTFSVCKSQVPSSNDFALQLLNGVTPLEKEVPYVLKNRENRPKKAMEQACFEIVYAAQKQLLTTLDDEEIELIDAPVFPEVPKKEPKQKSKSVDLSKRPSTPILRRQDSPQCYDMNGSIYIWKRDVLLNSDSVFVEKTGLYIMPEERSIDIDTKVDFSFAEFMMNKKINKYINS